MILVMRKVDWRLDPSAWHVVDAVHRRKVLAVWMRRVGAPGWCKGVEVIKHRAPSEARKYPDTLIQWFDAGVGFADLSWVS